MLVSLSGDHRGSDSAHLAVKVPPASGGAERRAADQAALCPAEGLLQGWSRPRGELPPGPELLQGIKRIVLFKVRFKDDRE